MQNERKLLIGALAQAVAEKPLSLPEPVDWTRLCDLADAHKVAPLVYDGLQKAGIPLPEEISQRLYSAYMQAIFDDSQLEYTQQQLSKALTENHIRHIFFKGAVLKNNYPVPGLRTMCDMDVLVYIEDYPAIDRICKALGGRLASGDGNHHSFHFPGGVLVEFHPNLVHQGSPVGSGINPGWQYAKSDCAAELTEEGFYLSLICHMADHFVGGGVGVRFVLDVWVFRHLRNRPLDCAFVERELTSFGLLDFARKIERLSDIWFGDGRADAALEELAAYIVTSGSHGVSRRAMLNAVTLSKGGNKSSALWSKAFYPREELEGRYPWCKNRPYLLPAAWCARAFRAVTVNGDKILAWSKATGQFSKREIDENREKLERMGIQARKK